MLFGLRRATLFGGADAFPTFDFLTPSLPVGATLTRASNGTRFNSSGVLVTETTDVARFTYDPASLALQGLLVELSRTNFAWPSVVATSGANWGAAGTAVTLAQGTAPDGANAASRLTATVGAVVHREFDATSAPGGVRQLNSVYAKAGTASWLGIAFGSSALTTGAFFDLTNGVVGTVAAGFTATIASAGGGWYRCVAQCPVASADLHVGLEPHTADNQIDNWSAAGTENVLIWGVQKEIGAAVAGADTTSLIAATSAASTRAADVLTLTLANGTYDIDVTRLSGLTTLTGQVVGAGTFTVPTDVSPLQRVVARRTA